MFMQNFIKLSAVFLLAIVLTERQRWWKQHCRRFRGQ